MRKILSFFSILTLLILLVSCAGKTFTITFESNGGTAIDPIEVKDGEIPSMPDDPTRDGYVFDGWFLDEALSDGFDSAEAASGNITVYAAWISILEAARDELDLGNLSGLTNDTARLILPTSLPDFDGVTISWVISDTDVIALTGVIMQPTHDEGDATVTLTATLTYGSSTVTKTFTATVTALPSPEDAVPLIDEDWTDYDAGALPETGFWGPVSGKSGSSLFTVVNDAGLNIPDGSNALKIEALTERQVEGAMPHTYDVVVIEADVMQTATSGGSAINIQTSASSPVIGFGVQGAGLFYRTDNGTQYTTEINVNQWYRIRLEADLVNKTIQVFYYLENGQLSQITPGKVSFSGTTTLQSIFIRSGSSTTTTLQEPAYITNIIANRIEALPRPTELIEIGEVMGIPETVNVEQGATFTPSVPTVYNAFGELRELVLNTDYTVAVTNPVDVNTPDDYTVTYTITNATDAEDVVVIDQTVTVYSTAQPNVISSVSNTLAVYPDLMTDITVITQQPEGELYVYYSDNDTETAETIKTATPVTITAAETVIPDVDASMGMYVHVIVVFNGDSNIVSQMLEKQELIEISTAQEFFDAVHMSTSEQSGKYFMLTADIDFASYTWVDDVSDWRSTLDGAGHTISNLSVSPTARGGIFDEIEDGSLMNLILDNITVNNATTNTSALLFGEVNGTVTISNVIIMNSTIDGYGDYAALIVGRVRSAGTMLTLENIAVIDSVVNGHLDYAGGLIAGQDTGNEILVRNIYINGFEVNEAIDDTGQMVGGIIGRGQSTLTIENVVAIDLTINAIKNIGGLVGKIDTIDSVNTFTNIFLHGEMTGIGSSALGSLVGNVEAEPTVTNAWTAGFANVASGLSVDVAFQVDLSTVQDLAWWTANMPDLDASELWGDLGDGSLALVNYTELLKPLIDVTLMYNMELSDEVVQVRQDDVFDYMPLVTPGYQFVGWYTDVDLLNALVEPYTVTAAVTLYGKIEAVPASTVAFDLGDSTQTVDDQMINYGELATEPVIADEMLSGVMKEVTGWTLNGNPYDFSTPVTEDITLVAVWETKVYTVSFNTGDSSDSEADQMIAYGELATAPLADPTHRYDTNFSFVEWQVEGAAFDFNTPITGDTIIVAVYAQDTTIVITTLDGFHDMATIESDYTYELGNDLDFTGYTWVDSDDQFSGVLDGMNYTISNLSMTKTDRGGIFYGLDDATISNLVFDNIQVSTDQTSAALFAGEVRGTTTISNVVLMNSDLVTTAADGKADYAALIAGRVRSSGTVFTLNNIAIYNSSVTNSSDYTGGLIAGQDSDTTIAVSDLYLYGFTVTEASNDSGQMVGAIVGRANATVTIERVVAIDLNVDGIKNVGGLIGKIDTAGTTNTFTDIFLQGEVSTTGSSAVGSLVGNVESDPVVTNVWTVGFANANSGLSVDVANQVDSLADVQDSAWWTTNMSNITGSALWVSYGGMMALDLIDQDLPPIYMVTIVFSTADPDEVLYVEAGTTAGDYMAPMIIGYEFDALYEEDTHTTAYLDTYEVVSDLTAYALYNAVSDHTVTFDITPGVNAAPAADTVSHYDVATEPVVADEMLEGVMKEVTGWTLNGNPFDFDTPVTEDMTLVAVWETKQYTVSFDMAGGLVAEADQVILYNGVATEPADPTHIFSELVFVEWQSGGVAYNFADPVVADLTLVAVYADPVGDVSIDSVDEFYYMATNNTGFDFVLSTDLDFSSFSWDSIGGTFTGTFDGQEHTITGISMDLGDRAGIFKYFQGTFENLIIEDATIISTGRAGVIAGEINAETAVINNVHFVNVSVTGASDNGVGAIAGLITDGAGGLTASTISVINSDFTNSGKNAGGLLGYVRGSGATALSDIYLYNVTVHGAVDHVGGIAGYVRNPLSFALSNVVIDGITITQDGAGGYAASVIGRMDTSTVIDIQKLLVVDDTITAVKYANTIVGRYDTTDNASFTIANVFSGTTTINVAADGQAALTIVDPLTIDATWWSTNLPDIDGSLVWTNYGNLKALLLIVGKLPV